MPSRTLRHVFVDRIPSPLQPDTLYISRKFSTSAHLCCCGCGNKVVTPLKAGNWTLIVRNDKVSLDPSIGNWSLACRSHYWIRDNKVIWARDYSAAEVSANRAEDREAREAAHAHRSPRRGIVGRILDWLLSWFGP